MTGAQDRWLPLLLQEIQNSAYRFAHFAYAVFKRRIFLLCGVVFIKARR